MTDRFLVCWLAALALPLDAASPPVTDGLRVHLDAGEIPDLADGATVTLWPDLAVGHVAGDPAQDAHLGLGTGSPTFRTSDPLFSGHPSVVFDGSSALGSASSLGLSSAEGAQGFTVFIVATNQKTAISTGFSFGDIKNNTADGAAGASVKCDLSISQAGLRFNDGNRLFGPGFEPGRPRIGLFRMSPGQTYNEALLRTDHRPKVASAVTNPANSLNLADEGYHIGAGLIGGSGILGEFADAHIAEILFYDRDLDENETQKVGYYLSEKYNLTTAYTDPEGDPPPPSPRPNVVLLLMDDTGWSDLGCYGGEARTPHMDDLAAHGLRFRNFHNTARCSTTRAALLTGAYTHQVVQNPGASLPDLRTDNNLTLAELFFANGYRTYMGGKWHNGSDPGERTTDRGFQHVFGFGNFASGAGVDYWDEAAHHLISAEEEITQHDYPDGTFYQSDAIGDHAIDFLDHHFSQQDGANFFLYLPFNPPHFDLQAPAALADTYMETYGAGWDTVRAQRYQRMLDQGVIDSSYLNAPFSDTPYNDNPTYQPVPAWTSLDSDRQADLVRRMALYAAMIEKVDENLGRVIEHLRTAGQLDNTLVMIISDNGGNAEGGVFGKAFGINNYPPLTGNDLAQMGQAGVEDHLWLGGGWANVCNTPFRYYKRYSHEGGIRTPLIAHWPQGITDPGRWTDQYGHVIDVMATLLDATNLTFPETYGGHPLVQPEGSSLLPVFRHESEFPRQVGYEHESTRAWVDGEWKLVTKTFSSTDGSSPANLLELYHLPDDPTELNNLAAVSPQRVRSMVEAWNAWATRVGVPSQRLLDLAQRPPSPLTGDLFVDTFNRPADNDIDASSDGMAGHRVPPLGNDATYAEGFEGSGTSDSIQVLDHRLLIASGIGMAETGILHNFVGADIIEAGGFSVEMTITALNSENTEPADRYCGFGVGLSEAEALSGSDISAADSFRGRTTNPIGKADFFLELDLNGNLKAWSKGQLLSTVALGASTGTLTARFALSGFTTADTVDVAVFFNGRLVDLNPDDSDSVSRSFQWDFDQTNYLGLSARASGYAAIDNLAVRRLPLAEALSVQHAVSAGWQETDSAPDADPDHDGRPNFLEWAIGSDPAQPDPQITPLGLVSIDPGTSRFRIESRRLHDSQAAGVHYQVLLSTDLVDWTPVDATLVSSPQPVPDSPGYETVELELPAESVSGQSQLFALISIQPNTYNP
ncbi:arylsulfatase A-like enzyme [Haloferula luteola]|uniref:Arylsulfatase A-like enzyme n=1 Tax=Haloferula luteola TaxID=595692 RepID=A0A840V1H8_9BACT|nr:arylsulfatase [Haloferula luteola]MBB5351845.1 arylsulfatase A-like enzyme [Haloferula luteola]